MTNAYQLAQSVVGQSVGSGECVALVDWIAMQYGHRLWGNGNQIGTDAGVSAFADVLPYTPGMELKVGDILSTFETTTPYGHTGVYGGGPVSNALYIEQNYNYQRFVIEHRRNIEAYGAKILRVVRIRAQDNYSPGNNAGGSSNGGSSDSPSKKSGIQRTFYEITCDKVEGIKGVGDHTVLDTFYKCNKVTGKIMVNG